MTTLYLRIYIIMQIFCIFLLSGCTEITKPSESSLGIKSQILPSHEVISKKEIKGAVNKEIQQIPHSTVEFTDISTQAILAKDGIDICKKLPIESEKNACIASIIISQGDVKNCKNILNKDLIEICKNTVQLNNIIKTRDVTACDIYTKTQEKQVCIDMIIQQEDTFKKFKQTNNISR